MIRWHLFFYLPQELSSVIITAIYIPPQADMDIALSPLRDMLNSHQNKYLDAAFIITGDFNKANPREVMPNCYQHIMCHLIWGEKHWPTATFNSGRAATRPIFYLRLANPTMLPSFSYQTINKECCKKPQYHERSDAQLASQKPYCRIR